MIRRGGKLGQVSSLIVQVQSSHVRFLIYDAGKKGSRLLIETSNELSLEQFWTGSGDSTYHSLVDGSRHLAKYEIPEIRFHSSRYFGKGTIINDSNGSRISIRPIRCLPFYSQLSFNSRIHHGCILIRIGNISNMLKIYNVCYTRNQYGTFYNYSLNFPFISSSSLFFIQQLKRNIPTTRSKNLINPESRFNETAPKP